MDVFVYLALLVSVFSGVMHGYSTEREPDSDTLLEHKRLQQQLEEQTSTIGAGDNANLLNEIVKKLDNIQQPCHENSNAAMDERMSKIEEAISRLTNDVNDRLANDLDGVKSSLINMKEDINENRQYASSKYHELRVDLNDNQETANTKRWELKQSIDKLKQAVDQNAAKRTGSTYVRWGRTTCPNGADIVYTGYAGGSWYDHPGAAVSMLCLPKNPDWAAYTDGAQSYSGFLYGVEFEPSDGRTDRFFGNGHSQHDVPCTVCYTRSRASSIMLPGKRTCPATWSLEYKGYLMSGRYSHRAASDYYCIDVAAETLPGGVVNKNGYTLYFVESRCGSLKCPPYVEGREMTCVVCSK